MTGSLRERKKEATRQAMYEAAVRLAIAHGLDHVTVEAIAEAADVSRRTFSNHFSGKEEAVCYGDTLQLRRFVERVERRPPREAPWDALTRATLDILAEILDDPHELERRRLIRSHPGLAPYRAAAYSEVERDLAAAIAPRLTGDDATLRSKVVAAAFLAALRVALQHWMANPERSRDEVVATALAATRH
jgi:AcrR family transcriptional regulator